MMPLLLGSNLEICIVSCDSQDKARFLLYSVVHTCQQLTAGVADSNALEHSLVGLQFDGQVQGVPGRTLRLYPS